MVTGVGYEFVFKQPCVLISASTSLYNKTSVITLRFNLPRKAILATVRITYEGLKKRK